MDIGILSLEFHLPGCRSLKEKRRRLSGLRDRFGRNVQVAVCEEENSGQHQRAQWYFVCVANNRRLVEQTLTEIESWSAHNLDAVICGSHREYC